MKMEESEHPSHEDKRVKEWEHHSSYQWSYFPEEVKQVISFFLSGRLHGKNLDLGSGWYSHYPDSTALDLTKNGLDYNPSKEKVHFDLEDIARGKKLPFQDHSFDSATMVSVWQYIGKTRPLMRELERVLAPGAEVFIINDAYSGLRDLFKSACHPKEIENQLKEMGYDCILERIPFGRRPNQDSFHSVTVAMPDTNLFGRTPSKIARKNSRGTRNRFRLSDQKGFLEDFARWEARRAGLDLQGLTEYPITAFSREYLQKLEDLGTELNDVTGAKALIFMDGCALDRLSLDMALPGETPDVTLNVVREEGGSDKDIFGKEYRLAEAISKKRGIDVQMHANYFSYFHDLKTIKLELDQLYRRMQALRDNRMNLDSSARLDSLFRFLASFPLNKTTTLIQKEFYAKLWGIDRKLDSRLNEIQDSHNTYWLNEHKQKRRIGELLEQKRRIISEGFPVVGHSTLDSANIIGKYFKSKLSIINEMSSSWSPQPGFIGADYD